MPGLIDRLRSWAFGLIADPRFQRWAADFPLTRPIAQRQARAAFDLCAGFVYSQVLLACVRLEVLEALGDGPLTVEALAIRCGLPTAGMLRLLEAAAALKLVSRRADGQFGLGSAGAAMRGQTAITDMIRHHEVLYRDLSDPVALLKGEIKGTALSRYWAYSGVDDPAALRPGDVADYTKLMSSSVTLIAGDILHAYSFGQHRALVDMGGGDGSFVEAAAQRHASLRCTVFDLPAVAELATARFARQGLSDRCSAIGGDMLKPTLTGSCDLLTLVRVILDHDDESAVKILRHAAQALQPDGTLLLAEPQADVPGAQAMGKAYFGFYLLAMGQGRPRSFSEISALLSESGFETIRPVRTRRPLLVSLIAARLRK
jgi:demethylspheroidene O-methyltransferase